MEPSRPAKRKYGDIKSVTLYVGKNKTAFQVHEALLFEHSAVFKASFGSIFQEAFERTMTLPEDDVGRFEDFVHWLYTQQYKIPAPEEATPKESTKHDEFKDQAMRLFILADKYDVLDLKKHICMQLLDKAREGYRPPNLGTIAYAYEHLPDQSSLRRVLVDWCVPGLGPEWFQNINIRSGLLGIPEFTVDLAASLSKRTKLPERSFMFAD